MNQMQGKIKKWGNSLGLRIPKSLIEELELKVDSAVEIDHKNGALTVTPIKDHYSLNDLVEQIRPGNLHRSDDEIEPQGNETW